jgi:hypothetical protein
MSLEPAAILSRFPGPVVLVPSRRKWLLVLGGCLVFVAAGLWMRHDVPVWGWLAVAFFGVGALIAVLMLLPGAGGLRLDADGFEMTSLFRRHRSRWTEVSEFEVVRLPPSLQKMVVFDDARTKDSALAKANRSLAGRTGGLPDNYSLSYEDLAAIMNAWRARATGRTAA